MKRLSFIILLLLIFFYGCEKEEDYSEIPFIKFLDFYVDIEETNGFINQTGILNFEFIDGDGNLGFYENPDSINDTTVVIIYDILIREYTKIDGNYIVTDSVNNNYWLPYFEEGVYRKHLKGNMQVKIYLLREQANDTVKYEFQIMDRDYQLSNYETTPELVIPEWN